MDLYVTKVMLSSGENGNRLRVEIIDVGATTP